MTDTADTIPVHAVSSEFELPATTVDRLIQSGTLPAYKKGRLLWIRRADLMKYVETNTERATDD